MTRKRNNHGHPEPPSTTTHHLPDDERNEDDFLALTLSSAAHRRVRRKPSPDGTIVPPYPWSTDRRATVHSLAHLLSIGITSVAGDVECKRCDRRYSMEFDLREKAEEILPLIAGEKDSMRHRAPEAWYRPGLLRCRVCSAEGSVRPRISEKKRSINWLFLLLGKMVGFCKLEQLKYFCKHTGNHRTGAKNRLLFLTYLGICKQLDPDGPFNI